MRRSGIFLVLGLLILAGLFFLPKPGADVATKVPAEVTPLPAAKLPVIGKTAGDEPRRSPGPPSSAAPEEDPEHPLIPFVVKDGFAVAFGDVILGLPEEKGIQMGHFRLEDPAFWDKPEIPYAIDGDVPEPERILDALHHITAKTGVRFPRYTDQPDAIHFQNGKQDCWSTLGRQGGLQPIRLSPRCEWREIAHEVLHSMGFIHEQSRFDRDDFVNILWDNIKPDAKAQFEKLPKSIMGTLADTAFDYESLMLYDTRAFARQSDLNTMQSKTQTGIRPSGAGLSAGDIRKIKSLFRLD